MTTKYPFAKIDPTNRSSFQTINITFLSTPPLNTPTVITSVPHGYTNYVPTVWGLWNVTTTTASKAIYNQNYGTYISSSSLPSFELKYDVNSTNVVLTVTVFDTIFGIDLVGVMAKLSLYVFVDDLQSM